MPICDCVTIEKGREMTEKMTILLAEDDRMSAEATRELLESQGWSTEWASDGRKAWTLYQRRKPDLVLLDLDMPKMDGLTLIQQMRETDKRTPIVLYSGKAGTAEEVKALEAGASDVVGKGAEPEVLIARLKAAYRRCCAEGEEPHVYRLSAKTTYNSASRRLRTDEEETVLKEKEGVLLHTLCARRGEAVSEEALLKGLWGEGILSKKHALQNLVSRLRKRLEADEEVQLVKREDGYVLEKE